MMLKEVIKKADILLEVVDARFPDETRNSEVERDIARSKKPFIIVLNKCDLVSKETIEKTRSRLSQIAPTVFVSIKDRFGTTMLRHKILETAGIKGRDILVGSLGYPNTGKSSVINGVAGKHKASTSPISGHTKGLQLVNAGSRIMFIDTPGVIPFGENDEYIQGILAVKDATHLQDPIGVAMKIIEKMCAENKPALESFYHVTIEAQDSYDTLILIGRQSNFLRKKGEVDETRAAIKIINDWQKGLLMI
ncbi:putative GTPase [Candidatus Methanoperedens nitroreducens]|uniref:Putative GTPase n=2 Tax=Candidatus Methanoperedens nitratireducens TaxID=1392998 RepID=A0A284VJX4_9EURY|nr:putative GTPase [Candidatus Methanoperedens nitroreducens]